MKAAIPSLPHVLSGARHVIADEKAGRLSYYVDGPDATDCQQPPMLLLHSINASPSAHEIKPLFDAYKTSRRTYALDLPGFGHSERSDRPYRQSLMVDAIVAVLDRIRKENQDLAVDILAVSLSCEFVAKVALQAPQAVRSLAMVSPTGMAKITKTHGPPEADCGMPGLYRALRLPLFGRSLFRLLTAEPTIRFFLRKTWGSRDIDEEMFRYSLQMCRFPGAHHAPFCFVGGFLFSADIPSIYKALTHPVWLSHGVRGDFTDFSRAGSIAGEPNWKTTVFETGALPYFEVTEEFTRAYDEFLRLVAEGTAVNTGA